MKSINDIVDGATAMSTKEARKKLGFNYRRLTDDQIERVVSLLSRIAKQSVQDLGSKILS